MVEEARRVVVLDVMPDGQIVPVLGEKLPDFTQPPAGLPRPARRRWQRQYDYNRKELKMPADMAWFYASKLTLRGFSGIG